MQGDWERGPPESARAMPMLSRCAELGSSRRERWAGVKERWQRRHWGVHESMAGGAMQVTHLHLRRRARRVLEQQHLRHVTKKYPEYKTDSHTRKWRMQMLWPHEGPTPTL